MFSLFEVRRKSIAFVSNTEEATSQGVKEKSLEDDISLLRKKFNKTLKYLDKKWMTNVSDQRSNTISQDNDRNKVNPNSGKGNQCFECGGYGHIRTDALTF